MPVDTRHLVDPELLTAIDPYPPVDAPIVSLAAVLSWVHDQAAALGVDRSRVLIKGESAGGGLAAARATDLTGLPPAFISVGALDLFLEENLDYGRRLTRAGIPVELHVYPGAFHGFGAAAEARTALAAGRDSREALRRAMFG